MRIDLSALDDFDMEKAMRGAEHRKYAVAYAEPAYRMHGSRQANAQSDLLALPCRGSLLDIGCGRGEMLDFAETIGFQRVFGIDVVPALIDGKRVIYGEAHSIPYEAYRFDVVTAFDVIEHLLPGDDEAMCMEMQRVARKHILVTANNYESRNQLGEDLHINKRPYEEWDELFRKWFDGTVRWIPTNHTHATERWRIDL